MKLISTFCPGYQLRPILLFLLPISRPANYNTSFSGDTHLSALQEKPKSKTFTFGTSPNPDTYNYNVKISNLGRYGQVKQARQLFDEMPQRDAVSYASMITVYLKNNDLPSAENLFRNMPMRNIVAESAMVHGYVKAGDIVNARRVFDSMQDRNVFSWTSLISGYFAIGQVDEAVGLFERMPEKNVVSWSTVVLGYGRNGLIDEARNTFDCMPFKNTVAWTTMLKSYVENNRFDEACSFFYEMPQRNLYSWNIMISACLYSGRVTEAVQLFSSMAQRNAVSWTSMVTGLAHNGLTTKAREYFDRTPNRDTAAWNAMISAYVDEGLMVEATELLNSMPERNIVTWNATIDGYARSGSNGEALNHLILMLRSCFMPNETTITTVSTSCRGLMELIQVHALGVLLGFEHDTSLCNALVTMYARSGDLGSARLAFECLKVKDVVSWSAMILAYSNHGFGEYAIRAFGCMLRSGIEPDGITFVGVLSACSHAGLVKKGQKFFDSMSRVYGIEPKSEHYSCLVDILGRAGKVGAALSVVGKIPPSEQDGAVLGALLGACRFHGDVELANHVGEKLIELEPNSSGGYVLLSNIYASRGKWDEFALVRKKMKMRNVNKFPGISQIDINGKSHVFYVGDRSHPEAKNIYELLQETLLPLMLKMAYTSKHSSDWFGSEEM